MTIPQRGGLPHSDIHGSTPARGSPWLFAACHVLHRLLVPRHPPNALLSLEIAARLSTRHPPCTETILSGRYPRIAESLLLSTQQSPLNTIPSLGCRSIRSDLRWKRPETHQNLIHPDKDQVPPSGDTSGIAVHAEPSMPIACRFSAIPPDHPQHHRRGGGGDRTRTDDPLLAKQVLSQLSYTPVRDDRPQMQNTNRRRRSDICSLTAVF